jgi:hypothetical protein
VNRSTILKLVLFLVGIIVFAFGVRDNRPEVRWAAIAFIAAAFLMRWLPKDRSRD